MQKGDKIVTIAGIHGKINKVNDDGTLELETSRVVISRSKKAPSAWNGLYQRE